MLLTINYWKCQMYRKYFTSITFGLDHIWQITLCIKHFFQRGFPWFHKQNTYMYIHVQIAYANSLSILQCMNCWHWKIFKSCKYAQGWSHMTYNGINKMLCFDDCIPGLKNNTLCCLNTNYINSLVPRWLYDIEETLLALLDPCEENPLVNDWCPLL